MKIKKIFAVLMMLVLLMQCGCASATEEAETPPQSEEKALPAMGNIYLTTDGSDSWEYMQASIRADWDGEELPEQTIQIKLRGNSSTMVDKKSYNIKFAEKTEFMDLGEGKKWSLLANPYDKSLLRISLAFDYAESIGLPYVPDSRLCKLWLNDRYTGIYVVMEPIGDGKDRIDIDVNNGDFIVERDLNRTEEGKVYLETDGGFRYQINEPETPNAEQLEAYTEFLDSVYEAVKTLDHTEYEKIIDIDSFVNFYIFEELVKDVDFGEFSTRYFVKDGKLYAGPPWDLDLSMGNVSTQYGEDKYKRYHNKDGFGSGSGDSTEALWVQRDYYTWLTQDEYFRELVCARWQELYPMTENLVQENELGTSLMDRYLETYKEDLKSNYGKAAGWMVLSQYCEYADQSVALTYDGNVNELREWLTKRIAWLNAQFGAPDAETDTAGE